MTPEEAVILTRYVEALCPSQKFDEYTSDAWHDVLNRYGLDEARRAAATVAGRQPFVSPGEIAVEIRRTRADRMARDAETEAPPIDPNQAIDYATQLRQQRLRVATGQAPVRALEAAVSVADVKAMRQQDDLKAFMRQAIRDAAASNAHRKALVKRHPDLWEAIHALPGHKHWSGSIGDHPHTTAIVTEAQTRDAARSHPNAA